MWTIRPTTRGESKPGPYVLLWIPLAYGLAVSSGFDLRAVVLGAIIGLFCVAHWWNAAARVVGRELQRTNVLGATTVCGQVKWASVDATGRYRRILCTLEDTRMVVLDGDWSNARGLYEALGEAGVASRSPWPERWSDVFLR